MAHYPAFPGPGTAPSSTAPTAAEKAAMDAATSPNADNPFMTHGPAGDVTNAVVAALAGAGITTGVGFATVGPGPGGVTLTTQQAQSILGSNLNGTNLPVSVGTGGSLSTNQLGGISANGTLTPANKVVSESEQAAAITAAGPMIARGNSGSGTQVTWNTGRTDLTSGGWCAQLLYFPATGPVESIDGDIITNDPTITFGPSSFAPGGKVFAILVKGTAGALNVS